MKVVYTPTTELKSDDEKFKLRFVNDWYEAQKDFINSTDTTVLTEEPVWEDKATYFEVIPYQKKKTIAKDCEVKLYGDRITVSDGEYTDVFSYDECFAVTVLGKNKLDIYYGDEIYQISPPERFSALMYVHIFNRYQNIKKGNLNGTFLGL